MNTFSEVAFNLIIILATISTILAFLDALGFLPRSITKWITKNRLAFSLELLKEMGIKIEQIPSVKGRQLMSSLQERLREFTINERVAVGQIEDAKFDSFIDLQGATTDPKVAIFFARVLTTHMRQRKILTDKTGGFQFDFVACPKEGSPFLAYEFAQLVQKPIILHPAERKFRSDTENNFRAVFDVGAPRPEADARCVIVDDSTTGGRKVLNLVTDLRQFGFIVEDCLVVFEPKGKDARGKLREMGVTLHAITDGPEVTNG